MKHGERICSSIENLYESATYSISPNNVGVRSKEKFRTVELPELPELSRSSRGPCSHEKAHCFRWLSHYLRLYKDRLGSFGLLYLAYSIAQSLVALLRRSKAKQLLHLQK